jgi:hypothetical protein
VSILAKTKLVAIQGLVIVLIAAASGCGGSASTAPSSPASVNAKESHAGLVATPTPVLTNRSPSPYRQDGHHRSLKQLASDLRHAAQPALAAAKSTGQVEKRSQGHTLVVTPVEYVTSIDGVLRVSSAETRADLGRVIDAVINKRIRQAQAEAEIASVIARRRLLLGILKQISAPPAFARTHLTLIQSIRLSIADDKAIREWINATFARHTAAADRWWITQSALSTRATHEKAAFLRGYNELRRSLLDLRPLRVTY